MFRVRINVDRLGEWIRGQIDAQVQEHGSAHDAARALYDGLPEDQREMMDRMLGLVRCQNCGHPIPEAHFPDGLCEECLHNSLGLEPMDNGQSTPDQP